MPEAIYVSCSLFSAWCAVLLLRQNRAGASRLIFWTAVCFAGFALNNALLVADSIVFPRSELGSLRNVTALGAVGALVFGLVWESR